MKSNRRLMAVRHTPVTASPGLCYGQLDVPLALSYHEDIKPIRQQLMGTTFARVLSSPLRRCQKLAHDLRVGPVDTDPRLMELSFGQWEGQLWTGIPREVSEYWTEDVLNRTPPGGESFSKLIDRVRSLIDEPDLWQAGDSLLLVTHAGVIRALAHILEGQSHDACLRLPVGFGETRLWNL